MNIFTLLSVGAAAYFIVSLINQPKQWLARIKLLPILGFMLYARMAGMNEQAWSHAFIFGGLLALGVTLILLQKKITMDRVMLGINLFLFVGAIGFLFHVPIILKWYSASKGGPFFSCIVLVGLLSIFFTKSGFLGNQTKTKAAIRYGSFLLLASTIIALIWSLQMNTQGLLGAVVLPFFVLKMIQHQLERNL